MKFGNKSRLFESVGRFNLNYTKECVQKLEDALNARYDEFSLPRSREAVRWNIDEINRKIQDMATDLGIVL